MKKVYVRINDYRIHDCYIEMNIKEMSTNKKRGPAAICRTPLLMASKKEIYDSILSIIYAVVDISS